MEVWILKINLPVLMHMPWSFGSGINSKLLTPLSPEYILLQPFWTTKFTYMVANSQKTIIKPTFLIFMSSPFQKQKKNLFLRQSITLWAQYQLQDQITKWHQFHHDIWSFLVEFLKTKIIKARKAQLLWRTFGCLIFWKENGFKSRLKCKNLTSILCSVLRVTSMNCSFLAPFKMLRTTKRLTW